MFVYKKMMSGTIATGVLVMGLAGTALADNGERQTTNQRTMCYEAHGLALKNPQLQEQIVQLSEETQSIIMTYQEKIERLIEEEMEALGFTQGSEIDMRNLTEEQKQIKNNYAQQIQEAQEALKQVLCNAGLQIPEQKDKGHSLMGKKEDLTERFAAEIAQLDDATQDEIADLQAQIEMLRAEEQEVLGFSEDLQIGDKAQQMLELTENQIDLLDTYREQKQSLLDDMRAILQENGIFAEQNQLSFMDPLTIENFQQNLPMMYYVGE